MLIFYYVSMAVIGLGAAVTAVGIAYAIRYHAATEMPPRSEEEEQQRNRLGTTAASLVIIGLLLCGVGVLFM